MKKWLIILVLSVVLIIGCVIENNYTNKAFDFLENGLKQVAVSLEKDKDNIDTEKNIEMIASLHDEWHEKLKILRCIIWHSSNKDIEVGLSRAEWYIRENNYTEAVVEIYSLISYSEHYSEDFTISLENIF